MVDQGSIVWCGAGRAGVTVVVCRGCIVVWQNVWVCLCGETGGVMRQDRGVEARIGVEVMWRDEGGGGGGVT